MRTRRTRQQEIFQRESEEWLAAARKVARRIATERGTVSSDDVRKQCPITGGIHRNAVGSIFKTRDFIWTGVKRSSTPSRKAGMIGVYMLRDQPHI